MNPPNRIVSLIASATEIVCALGLEDSLVGISHECDFPQTITDRPRLSQPRLDPKASSAAIDQAVRSIVHDGLSVYSIDEQALAALKPTLIITQDHCDVCAVTRRDVEKATCELTGTNTRICTLHPGTLKDVFRDIHTVADYASVVERGRELVSDMQTRLNGLERRTQALPHRPTIACVEWMDPPMVAGGWMPTLVHVAGGTPVLVHPGESFQTVDWDTVRACDPDVLVLMPCGFPVQQTLQELAIQEELCKTLANIPAVQQGRGYVVDGNAFFNRPGPRLVESAEILAALLSPNDFSDLLSEHRASIVSLNDVM